MLFPDKSVFVGQTTSAPKRGMIPHGYGVLTKPDQSKYEGKFQLGVFQGPGKITYANGDVIEANWVNGEPKGKAKLIVNGVIKEKDF